MFVYFSYNAQCWSKVWPHFFVLSHVLEVHNINLICYFTSLSYSSNEINNCGVSMCIASTGCRWPDLLRELLYVSNFSCWQIVWLSYIYLVP
jgi:hypothetical protein